MPYDAQAHEALVADIESRREAHAAAVADVLREPALASRSTDRQALLVRLRALCSLAREPGAFPLLTSSSVVIVRVCGARASARGRAGVRAFRVSLFALSVLFLLFVLFVLFVLLDQKSRAVSRSLHICN